MNKKLAIIIGLQALLIVMLFWMLIFYGKDEYEDFRAEQEEEIEGPNHVSEKAGVSTVSLSPAVQKNSGITTTKVSPMLFKGEIKSFGNVISMDSLIEAKAKFLNLSAELTSVRASSHEKIKQYQRLTLLNTDDKNVSDRAVQEAQALVNADEAKIASLALQIKNLQTSMKLQWGEALAKLALPDKLPAHLEKLLNRTNVLLQVTLPINTPTPNLGDTIKITPLNEVITPIKAQYVSPAAQADSNGIGKTFYYSAPAELLRIGMRVNVEVTTAANENANGVVIPSSAVVWYAGIPWAYFKQASGTKELDEFVRKPISADTEVDTGWFNQGLSVENEVVVSGAQLLLSEEFKYLIKNENED
ncbi:MAG: hypothetical protein ACT4OH_00750 [Methylophilaceae bacterium]